MLKPYKSKFSEMASSKEEKIHEYRDFLGDLENSCDEGIFVDDLLMISDNHDFENNLLIQKFQRWMENNLEGEDEEGGEISASTLSLLKDKIKKELDKFAK